MPLTTLELASEVSRGATWTYFGGPTNFTNLKLPDDTANYMESGDATGDSRYTLDDLPAEAGVITLVQSRVRAFRVGGNASTTRTRLTTAGGTVNSPTFSGWSLNPTYLNHFETFNDAPGQTGWSVAEINAADLHYEKTAGAGGSEHRITTLTLEVTWEPPVDGFVLFAGSWLPPLLAAASHGLAAADVVRVLCKLKHRPTGRRELARILEAFRRRPVYAFGAPGRELVRHGRIW